MEQSYLLMGGTESRLNRRDLACFQVELPCVERVVILFVDLSFLSSESRTLTSRSSRFVSRLSDGLPSPVQCLLERFLSRINCLVTNGTEGSSIGATGVEFEATASRILLVNRSNAESRYSRQETAVSAFILNFT